MLQHIRFTKNYAVGNVNFISASRQGNFRDLEVKNSSNTATILLTGDGELFQQLSLLVMVVN